MDKRAQTIKCTSKIHTAFWKMFEELTGRAPTLEEIHAERYQKAIGILKILFLPLMEKAK